jgi:hypothetical protein
VLEGDLQVHFLAEFSEPLVQFIHAGGKYRTPSSLRNTLP